VCIPSGEDEAEEFWAQFKAMLEEVYGVGNVHQIGGSLPPLNMGAHTYVKMPPYEQPTKPETELEYLERLISYTHLGPNFK